VKKLAVEISSIAGPGIIVKCESQVFYTRQTGGVSLNIREMEGCYLPFDFSSDSFRYIETAKIIQTLRDLFGVKSKYGGASGLSCEMDEETAITIDGILEELTRSGPLTKIYSENGKVSLMRSIVKVDRELLHKSLEAWIFVTIQREDNVDLKGVFTWENSD
jgi:hypothetical protein